MGPLRGPAVRVLCVLLGVVPLLAGCGSLSSAGSSVREAVTFSRVPPQHEPEVEDARPRSK